MLELFCAYPEAQALASHFPPHSPWRPTHTLQSTKYPTMQSAPMFLVSVPSAGTHFR